MRAWARGNCLGIGTKMTMDQEQGSKRVFSRRDLLKRAPLALASGIIVGIVAGRPLISRLKRRRRPPVFPKGSIFTPAEDPRDKV